MKSQLGHLDVVGKNGRSSSEKRNLSFPSPVPPDIIDYETSADLIVDEGQNVNLTCTAIGLPEPTIEWKREGNLPIMQSDSDESKLAEHIQEQYALWTAFLFAVYSVKGPQLIIRNVKRHQMGAYLCIASNGVPPSVSKRIILKVNCE